MNSISFFTYKKIILLACIMTWTSQNLLAQQKDFGLWSDLNLVYKINKKCDFSLVEELRFNENITELQSQILEPSFSYKIIKNTTLGVAYRWSFKRRLEDTYSERHRYIILVKYKQDIAKKWSSTLRLQYQNQYSDIGRSEDWQKGSHMLRCKLQPSYQYNKKNSISISAELLYNITDQRPLSAVRYALGWDYAIKKNQKISVGYMMEQEYNTSNPYLSSIINIGYEIELNKYFKKKK